MPLTPFDSSEPLPPVPAQAHAERQSHIITRLLTPAVHLWLRSQVESIQSLDIHIQGGDRQILSGYLPQVAVAAERAIYQGLHLSQLDLQARNIRINLGQVMRGKPLRLLEVIPVQVSLSLSEADLNASLTTPLLAQAVTDILSPLLQSADADHPLVIQHLQVALECDRLTLTVFSLNQAAPSVISTGLSVINGHLLRLNDSAWRSPLDPIPAWMNLDIDLGQDVYIEHLRLEAGQLHCQGRINVIP
jgi:hypothetical protein